VADERALELTPNPAEQALLRRRIEADGVERALQRNPSDGADRLGHLDSIAERVVRECSDNLPERGLCLDLECIVPIQCEQEVGRAYQERGVATFRANSTARRKSRS